MNPTMFPVVILAGGLATRLRPLTEKIPKALIEINGEPFISHQLRLLKKNRIKKVIICISYLGEHIIDFLGDGSRFDLEISYVKDGPQLLGTGGAIKKALPLLGDAFFVLYGDSYLPCDYQAVQAAFMEKDAKALMTVFHNNGLWDTSNVEFKKGKLLAYDKKNRTAEMQYIDYGLGVMTQDAFLYAPQTEIYDLADLYQQLLKHHQLIGYEVNQRFYEVGSFTGATELEHYLKQSNNLIN